MNTVVLHSGGLDSSLLLFLAMRENLRPQPLFIDYGQLAARMEWKTSKSICAKYGFPEPVKMRLAEFGGLIPSGITSKTKRINEDAFLPGRNLLFLLSGASYACAIEAEAIMIGLLSEESAIFPDQTREFLDSCEQLFSRSHGRDIKILAPLMKFRKSEVVALAESLGVEGTYSCHAGKVIPCGKCISCREFEFVEEEN